MHPSQQRQSLPAGYVEASSFIQAPEAALPSGEEATMSSGARISTTSKLASENNTTTAEPSKPTVSRDGIRGGKRGDNQPNVYRELPSFPKFDEQIPNDASIEEICINYPNHIRGTYLAAFVQWHWTANDIYNRLTDVAKQEFIDNGVATCKTKNNRSNFLSKRFDAYLNSLTAEEVTALCTQSKIRPCLMDGGERYGKSKLRGKFNNPRAQPVRQYDFKPRSRPGKREATEDLPQEPKTKKPRVEARSDTLWESMEIFEQYKYAMAGYWAKQVESAQTIINGDVFYSSANDRQRMQQVLKMLRYPVNSETDTFLTFDRIEDSPAFASFVDNKARAVFDHIRTHEAGAALREVRNKAIDEILREQQHIEASLQQLVPIALSSYQSGDLKFGLVEQAIEASISAPPRTTKPENATRDMRVVQQAPGWNGASGATMSAGSNLKRSREETTAEENSKKRHKTALSPGLNFVGQNIQQVFNAQQTFQPVEYRNRLEDAPGVGRDFDLMFEEIYGTSTAPPAASQAHGETSGDRRSTDIPFLPQTQNIVQAPDMTTAGHTSTGGRHAPPQMRTDAEDQALQEAIDMLPSLPPTPDIIYDQTDFSVVPGQNQVAVAAGNAYIPHYFDMFAQDGDLLLQNAELFPLPDLPESDGTYTQTGDLFSEGADLFSMGDLPQPHTSHDGIFDAAIEDLTASSGAANVFNNWDPEVGELTASELQQMQEDPAFWDGMFNDL
ncbi:hypothetical protein LTR10_013601 [Elasticomyces elasticus]|uniref:Clr5 domain-containing protein n=1 Tax=Exophiala sideris TaxID=1016849 RepID=A0ABR0JQ59_9EURO|nr:hypothetical protein LTR10_013601 [Elasticomyces elasticus]KAK5039740.1 hypothetical protein LTS07_000235 [Exophiala sideris]KAK5041292.1 hypothetical protein LTR13_002767 [Exophiala sideris]KAK5068118.1 hypothetical protein LTR69_000236 [Exophiala sideris]KAK5187419.1 hypothetical protein LTR44_000235 [Eurotiomycetes sp. CCFEE 6388]